MFGLWRSLTDFWTALMFFFSLALTQFLLHVGCHDLSWSHWQQFDPFSLSFEGMCVFIPIMYNTPIKLPRPSQEQVANRHGHTSQSIVSAV